MLCIYYILKYRYAVKIWSLKLEWRLYWAASHDNQSNLANWRYLPFPQHAPESENIGGLRNLFSRESARDPCFSPHLPLSQIPGPFFSGHEKSPLPLTNYPEHWDVKTFVVAIPIVYPQVEPILGELTQQGFDCFVCKSMENPLWPMRMFSVVFLRRGVKYPTLDCTPFQGTASFRPLKYTAVAVPVVPGSVLLDFFSLLVVNTAFGFL